MKKLGALAIASTPYKKAGPRIVLGPALWRWRELNPRPKHSSSDIYKFSCSLGFYQADSKQRDSHVWLADVLRRPYRRLVAATLQYITACVQPESSTETGRDLGRSILQLRQPSRPEPA